MISLNKEENMKKLLTIMACLMFVMVGGFVLSACGNGENISNNDFVDYISQDNVVSEFSGYELSVKFGNSKINATIASEGDSLNAKIEYPNVAGIVSPGTIYVKDNLVYFTTAENKYYMELDSYNESMQNINELLIYKGDLTDVIISFVEETTDDNLTIVKKTSGNKITFSLSSTITAEGIKTTNAFEVVYVDDVLNRLSTKTVTNNVTVTDISLNAFAGNIEFPDFSEYEEFSMTQEVDLEIIYSYIESLNCNWTSYEVVDGISQNVSYDAKISIENGNLSAEIIAEDGKKVYVQDGKLFFDNGTEKVWTTFDGLDNVNLDDETFGRAYELIQSAVVVKNDANYIFNSEQLLGDLKYFEEAISSGMVQATFDMTQDGNKTTFVATMTATGMTSSRTFVFDSERLLEYSAETNGQRSSYVYSAFTFDFPNFGDYVEVA